MSKPTRRTFLGTGAAVCALTNSSADAATPEDAVPFKLGVASISFLKFPRERAIAMTSALDVHYINIKSVHLALDSTPDQIRSARAEFDAAGLTVRAEVTSRSTRKMKGTSGTSSNMRSWRACR